MGWLEAFGSLGIGSRSIARVDRGSSVSERLRGRRETEKISELTLGESSSSASAAITFFSA